MSQEEKSFGKEDLAILIAIIATFITVVWPGVKLLVRLYYHPATPIELCNNIDDNADGQIDETYNLANDNQNCGVCGKACTNKQACLNGHCEWIYPLPNSSTPTRDPNGKVCEYHIDEGGNLDIDLQTDRFNCGLCGLECSRGELCIEGQCNKVTPECNFLGVIECQKFGRFCDDSPAIDAPDPDHWYCHIAEDLSYERCDNIDNNGNGKVDEFFDLTSDRDNCGQCGKVCSTDQNCIKGVCRTQVCEDEGNGYTFCHPGKE